MRNSSRTALALLLSCSTAWAAGLSDDDIEGFLLNAEVLSVRQTSIGVTRSLQATLRRGDLVHDAQIQRVDAAQPVPKRNIDSASGPRDYWGFNIAAYRMDRLLDLHMIPVSVARTYAGREAAFTWWLDNVQMMERQRLERRIQPPDPRAWNEQIHLARVFNELTANTDANLGNLLILEDWSLRLIDYTRAFGPSPQPPKPANLLRISRRLLRKLRELDEDAVQAACSPHLTPAEVAGLMSRRDRIVAIFEQKIAQQGEGAVLFGEL